MQQRSKSFFLPKGIYKEAMAMVTPRVQVKERKYGPLKNAENSVYREFSKDQLLEMRWMKEFGGWKRADVVRHYGITPQRATSILAYATCGDVVPYPDTYPAGYSPKNNTSPA